VWRWLSSSRHRGHLSPKQSSAVVLATSSPSQLDLFNSPYTVWTGRELADFWVSLYAMLRDLSFFLVRNKCCIPSRCRGNDDVVTTSATWRDWNLALFSAAETTVPCNSNLTSCWQPTTHLLWLLSRLPASSWNTGKKLRRKCYIVKMRKLWPSLNSLFLGYVTASCVASFINQLTVLASASNCCIRSRIFQSLFFNRPGLLGYWLCFMGHVAWYKRF